MTSFGCNTYSYMRTMTAEACVGHLAQHGFRDFELMVHPHHLWPADLPGQARQALRRAIETAGARLVTLNMPNVDLNIASETPEMRRYSLAFLADAIGLTGELGA